MNEFPSNRGQRPKDVPITTDRLRHDIDSGKTGDKVSHCDPAMAPLGTDEEAGGTHPVVMAEERQRVVSASHETATAHKRFIWGWTPLFLIAGFAFLGAAGAVFAAAGAP